MNTKTKARQRRARKSRIQMRTAGAVRLSVHRTGQHIYAQIIDDAAGKTVAAASTLGVKGSGANVDAINKEGMDAVMHACMAPARTACQSAHMHADEFCAACGPLIACTYSITV